MESVVIDRRPPGYFLPLVNNSKSLYWGILKVYSILALDAITNIGFYGGGEGLLSSRLEKTCVGFILWKSKEADESI